jgi:hypothetical protein
MLDSSEAETRAADASGNSDSDADVSLDKINPITQNGQHKGLPC